MSARLDWAVDGAHWPNRESSRFVRAGGLHWHVQIMGSGPVALLLHGTGASTHSWRDLAPLLARHVTVVAPDLPGHAFTAAPASYRMSLPWMARGLTHLLHALDVAPDLVIGHSAGAAIGARILLDGAAQARTLVSLNGAFMPFEHWAGQVLSPMAKLLAMNPVVPQLFAWRASDRAMVEKLLDDTGSKLDAAGVALYARLARTPSHVAGALNMMANWDLHPVLRELPRLAARLMLIAGEADRTIPPSDATRLHRLVPSSELVLLPGLGHLAHEEAPERIAALILDHASADSID